MNHLNYFAPYESRSPDHEDQLTRAFLVVLRLVPLAQAAFLDLVRDQQLSKGTMHVIPPLSAMRGTSEIETQIGRINQSSGTLISVLMTNEHWVASKPVEVSDRGARYDGVMCFSPDWILSIENKPWSYKVWEGQLSPNLPPESEVEINPVPVILTWDLVIARLGAVRSQGLLQWAEERLVDDFLEFVDENFPFLNPYKSFGVCKRDQYLLTKRCSSVLHEIAPGVVKYHRDNADYIAIASGPARQMYLYPKRVEPGGLRILLETYPGDTIAQARAFFEVTERNAFLGMEEKGWTLEPNLHFSFMAKNLVWPTTERSVSDYFDFWSRSAREIRQVQRDESNFQSFFRELLTQRLISDEDVPMLDRHFTETKRNSLNICPGFKVLFSWPLVEAEHLDATGQFVKEVKSRIQEALFTWGQTLDVIASNGQEVSI